MNPFKDDRVQAFDRVEVLIYAVVLPMLDYSFMALIRAWKRLNIEAKDSIRLGDLWNQTSNVANTTVGKLAEGFAIVARQAKDSGFSMTQLSAVLTPMIGVFDSGSEAGIAFSMTLTKLLNPTNKVKQLYEL